MMKCFFCGRLYDEERDENGNVRLICKFPRCKLHPCTDYHESLQDCFEDIEIIKESWRNSR